MSTNRKNFIRKAPLKNSTRNIQKRCILVERTSYNMLCHDLASVISQVNKTIQDVDLEVSERHIPYISCEVKTYDTTTLSDSRIVLITPEQNIKAVLPKLSKENISHCIEFQISAIYNQITFSNSFYDAKLVIDENFFVCAVTDLFLDLAMFNSYSFLKNMSVSERKIFSKQKFEFFKKHQLSCFYDYDESDELLYYSLAFSARETAKKINVSKYIALWDKFLQEYYPGKLHQEPLPEIQLKDHINYDQLSHKKISKALKKLPKGAYLLIKVNRRPYKPKIIAELSAIFPGNTLSLKKWKLIPLKDYHKIKKYSQSLHISVFKLINYY